VRQTGDALLQDRLGVVKSSLDPMQVCAPDVSDRSLGKSCQDVCKPGFRIGPPILVL